MCHADVDTTEMARSRASGTPFHSNPKSVEKLNGMSEDFDVDRIDRIRRLGNGHLRAIVKNIVSDLSSERVLLSGDDSGFVNLWEEFAVQITGEHSYFFNLYEDHVQNICMATAEKLSKFELAVLAFFTSTYIDWWYERDEANVIEPTAEELAEWIAKEMYSEIRELAEEAADEINDRSEEEPEDDEEE